MDWAGALAGGGRTVAEETRVSEVQKRLSAATASGKLRQGLRAGPRAGPVGDGSNAVFNLKSTARYRPTGRCRGVPAFS